MLGSLVHIYLLGHHQVAVGPRTLVLSVLVSPRRVVCSLLLLLAVLFHSVKKNTARHKYGEKNESPTYLVYKYTMYLVHFITHMRYV